MGCPFIYALRLILTRLFKPLELFSNKAFSRSLSAVNQMTIPRPSFELCYKLFLTEIYFLLLLAKKKQVGIIKLTGSHQMICKRTWVPALPSSARNHTLRFLFVEGLAFEAWSVVFLHLVVTNFTFQPFIAAFFGCLFNCSFCFFFAFKPRQDRSYFSRNKPVYSFYSTGPPMVPMLSALPLNMGSNGTVNLSCKANQLDAHQMASYKWKWMFNNGTEITNAFGKYKILNASSSLNSCQQKKGTVSLQIENLTKEDLGTYKCALLESDMEIAVEDVPLYGYGMFSALDCTWYGFDKKSNTLITRLTKLFPIF